MATFNSSCPCKRVDCERYGKCDECRKFHSDGDTSCDRLAAAAAEKERK